MARTINGLPSSAQSLSGAHGIQKTPKNLRFNLFCFLTNVKVWTNLLKSFQICTMLFAVNTWQMLSDFT